MEQELFTLPEHLSSLPILSGVRITRSLVLCVMFCRSLFFLLPFFFWPLCYLSFCLLAIVLSVLLSFGHCVICPSVFWPLCCLSVFDLWSLITSLVYSNSSQQYSLLGLFIKKNKQIFWIYMLCILALSHYFTKCLIELV